MVKKLALLAVGLSVATSGVVLAQNMGSSATGSENRPAMGGQMATNMTQGTSAQPGQGMQGPGMGMIMPPPCMISGDEDGSKMAAYVKAFFTAVRTNRSKMRAIEDAHRTAMRQAEDAFLDEAIAAADDGEDMTESLQAAQEDYQDAVSGASTTASKARRMLEKEQKAALKLLRDQAGCAAPKRPTNSASSTSGGMGGNSEGGQGRPSGAPQGGMPSGQTGVQGRPFEPGTTPTGQR